MIWYRHWLEMRFRAGVALLFILLTSFAFPANRLSPRLTNTAMGQLLGVEGSRSFTAHAAETSLLVLLLALMAASSGIISHGLGTGRAHRSTYYTLGLPISRTRIHATRFVAGALQIGAGFAIALALNCALLSWYGTTVPWRAMAVASAAGFIATLPAMALANLLILALGTTAGATGAVLATLGSLWGFVAIWSSSREGVIPWTAVAVALALTALLFTATLALIRRREF